MNEVSITVEGPVGSNKSAFLWLIEKSLRMNGFAFRYANPNEDIPEKNSRDLHSDVNEIDRGSVVLTLHHKQHGDRLPA